MAKGHIQKTLARKYAFKFLYPKSLASFEALASDEDTNTELDDFEESYTAPDDEHSDNELTLETKTFGRKLILSTLSNFDDVLKNLNPCLAPRTLDKLDMLERTIVILGASELQSNVETPAAILINEYVEMAKEYGNQKSYTFVNGVLDKYAKATR